MPRKGKYQGDMARWTPDKPLPNDRWELWACKVLQGMSKTQAAAEAGYNCRYTATLARNRYVRARMAYLMQAAADQATVTAGWWLREMYAIADADITDVVQWVDVRKKYRQGVAQDQDGDAPEDALLPPGTSNDGFVQSLPQIEITPSDDMPLKVRRAIKKMKVTYHTITDKVDIEVEMHDKMKALKILGDYLQMTGGDAARKPVEGVVRDMQEDEGRSVTNEDLLRIRQAAQWET